MPPSTARARWIIGRLGSYECSTIADIDGHLRKLRHQLTTARGPVRACTLHDVDQLLDRRRELQRGRQLT